MKDLTIEQLRNSISIKAAELEKLGTEVNKLKGELERREKDLKFACIPVCNLDYYDVRGGRCRYADTYHGSICCDHPKCKK